MTTNIIRTWEKRSGVAFTRSHYFVLHFDELIKFKSAIFGESLIFEAVFIMWVLYQRVEIFIFKFVLL